MASNKKYTFKYVEALKILSVREVQVLDLVLEGHTNSEIGEILYISKNTTIVHKKNITKKLGLRGRNSLFKWGINEIRLHSELV